MSFFQSLGLEKSQTTPIIYFTLASFYRRSFSLLPPNKVCRLLEIILLIQETRSPDFPSYFLASRWLLRNMWAINMPCLCRIGQWQAFICIPAFITWKCSHPVSKVYLFGWWIMRSHKVALIWLYSEDQMHFIPKVPVYPFPLQRSWARASRGIGYHLREFVQHHVLSFVFYVLGAAMRWELRNGLCTQRSQGGRLICTQIIIHQRGRLATGFPHLGTTHILDQIILPLLLGGPVRSRMLSSIFSLYHYPPVTPPSIVITRNVSRHCQISPLPRLPSQCWEASIKSRPKVSWEEHLTSHG